MKFFKATQARAEFQDVIDTAHYKEEPVIIVKRGKPWVIITSVNQADETVRSQVESYVANEKIQKLLDESK